MAVRKKNGSITLRKGTWPAMAAYCEKAETNASEYIQKLIDADNKFKDFDVGELEQLENSKKEEVVTEQQ